MYKLITSQGPDNPYVPNPGISTITLRGRFAKEAKVDLRDPISCLDNIIKKKNYRFVYNGMILNPAVSFSFYEINNKDTIYVIAPEQKQQRVSIGIQTEPDITEQLREEFNTKWGETFSNTASKESAFRNFCVAANPITAKEHARLSDFKKSKIEASPAGFRKCCRNYDRFIQKRFPKPAEEVLKLKTPKAE